MRVTAMILFALSGCAASLPKPQNWSEWQERFRACRAGDQRACYWRALSDLDGGRTAQGVKTMEAACEAGVAEACNQVGFFAGQGWYEQKVDPVRARALWARSCALGSKDGCDSWGTGLRDGVGGPRDLPGAAAAYERACKAEDAAGCTNLGSALLRGEGIKQDAARAIALWRAVCAREEEIVHSCRLLGAALVHGEGVAENVTEGLVLLRRACNLGDAEDCQEAGELMALFGSKPEAIRYLRTSCTWGRVEGCRVLGLRLLELEGKDELEEGRAVLRVACDKKDQAACARLAE